MCVFKNHAFIYFLWPPSWSGTISIMQTQTQCHAYKHINHAGKYIFHSGQNICHNVTCTGHALIHPSGGQMNLSCIQIHHRANTNTSHGDKYIIRQIHAPIIRHKYIIRQMQAPVTDTNTSSGKCMHLSLTQIHRQANTSTCHGDKFIFPLKIEDKWK